MKNKSYYVSAYYFCTFFYFFWLSFAMVCKFYSFIAAFRRLTANLMLFLLMFLFMILWTLNLREFLLHPCVFAYQTCLCLSFNIWRIDWSSSLLFSWEVVSIYDLIESAIKSLEGYWSKVYWRKCLHNYGCLFLDVKAWVVGYGGGVFECDALLWGDDGKWFSEIMGWIERVVYYLD